MDKIYVIGLTLKVLNNGGKCEERISIEKKNKTIC